MLLIVMLSSIVLSACSGSSEGPVKVKVGEVTRSMFYAPEYVALAEGFFKEEGLEVDLQTTAGGDKTMTALLSGVIDVALVGSETSVYVAQQGADDPVINFAQPTHTILQVHLSTYSMLNSCSLPFGLEMIILSKILLSSSFL